MAEATNPAYSPDQYSTAPSRLNLPQPRQRFPWSLSGRADDAGHGTFYRPSWAGMDEFAIEARSSHPFWRAMRLALLVMIVVCWLSLFIAAIVVIAKGDSYQCPGGDKTRRWFETAVGYQIVPASFQDSDGDGYGDIQGIITRLDYLVYLGVDNIWLGPVFKSPGVDLWMDITDLTAVDGVYGTMQDFEELVTAVHNKKMRLVLEFIPNHTSEQHPWFQASRQGPDNDYSDYYIWADGTDGGPPQYTNGNDTGWGWSWDSTRRQWYLYSFMKEEPDLKYRNPAVVRDVKAALKFWLEMGVDGFYMRHTNRLFEPWMQKDSPSTGNAEQGGGATSSEGSNALEASMDILDVISGWRHLLDQYEVSNGTQDNSKLLVIDTGSDVALSTLVYSNKSLGTGRADFPVNFLFLGMASPLNGHQVRAAVDNWISAGPVDSSRHWAVGLPDVRRAASRFGERFARAMLFLVLMLPGSPLIYYGDEIGMADGIKMNGPMPYDPATQAMRSDRELTRSPMQWSPDVHAGFTDLSSKPWVPVGVNASRINVELQMQDSDSPLAFIERTIQFRRNNSELFGIDSPESFRLQDTYNEVFTFTRVGTGKKSHTAVFAAINVAKYVITEDFEVQKERIPSTGTVVLATDTSRVGESITFSRLLLRSGEAILVQYDPLPKPDVFSEPYEE